MGYATATIVVKDELLNETTQKFAVRIHKPWDTILGTELDGVVSPAYDPVMRFSQFVGDGSADNTLTFIVSDTSDAIYDTTTFLSALGGSEPQPIDVILEPSIATAPVTSDPEVIEDVQPGESAEFDATFTGDGDAHLFDLQFIDDNTGAILGTLPVSINSSYFYLLKAIDPDGDDITYSMPVHPDGATIDLSTGLINWVPFKEGSYDFQVRADDGRGGYDIQDFTVVVSLAGAVGNHDPEIESTADPDAVVGFAYSYPVDATDEDNDSLRYFLEPHQQATVPLGMKIDRRTGVLTWVPTDTTANLPASVKVVVSDGRGGRDTELIVFNVQANRFNTNPDFDDVTDQNVIIGDRLVYQVTATDAESDPLVFDMLVGPSGLEIDSSSGRVGWRPEPGQAGEHDVILRVRDPDGAYDLASFTVTAIDPNIVPTITTSPPTDIAIVGHTFEYEVEALDPDVDPLAPPAESDELTFTVAVVPADPEDPAPTNPFTFLNTSSLDSDLLRWKPTTAEIGIVYVVTVTATDEQGAKDTQTFPIVAVPADTGNNPPSINITTLPTAIEDRPYRTPVPASDLDGDELEFSLDQGPDGMTIDPATGDLSWASPVDTGQTHTVVVHVQDGQGGEDRQTFNLAVYGNRAPIVSTKFLPGPATEGTKFQTEIEASDPDGDPITFSVEVKNSAGTVITAGNPTISATGLFVWNTPVTAGDYSVIVTVTDQRVVNEVVGTASTIVTYPLRVQPELQNRKPVIDQIVYSTTGAQSHAYQAQVTAHDPDGDPITYSVIVKDDLGAPVGSNPPNSVISITSDGLFKWVSPQSTGEFSVTVTVTDQRGLASDPATFTFDVESDPTNNAPIIDSFQHPSAITLNSPFEIQIPAHDPDGDPLLYTVDSVTPTPTQMPTISQTGLFQWNQPGPIASNYAIVVKVDDGRNGFATATMNIAVQAAPANNPPQILTLTLPGPANEGILYSTTILTHDPDGDPIVSYALDAASVSKEMAISSTGVLTWTPEKEDAGDHFITVTITDQRGATANRTFALTARAKPENHAPIIVTSGQLGRATVGTSFSALVDAYDPDGDPFTLAITGFTPSAATQPTINATTGIVSWPTPENAGTTYTLTVVATDERGLASSAVSLTLPVVAAGSTNNAPIIDSFSYSPRASLGSPYQLKIPAHDPDGDTITYTVVVKDSANNTVNSNPPSSIIGINSSSGLFSWNAPQTPGDYTFNVTVTDTQGASTSTGPLALKVVGVPGNNAPVVVTGDEDMPGPATKDDPYQVQIVATDQDGDAISYSVTITAPDASQVSGEDFSISATGLLDWDAPHQVGTYNVVVTVTDARQATSNKTLHVSVLNQTNHAPVIDTLQADITNPVANIAYQEQIDAHDPDGNPIQYTLDADSRGKGMTIDNKGRLTWAPTTDDAGSHSVEVSVTDNKAATSRTYTLVVGLGTNSPPQITSTAPTKVIAGQTFLYDVNATDADGDPIEYILDPTQKPAGMTINATTGLIEWTPGASAIGNTFAVRVQAFEKLPNGQGGFDYGQFDAQSFNIKVVSDPNNQSPTITSTPPRLTTLDRVYGYDAKATDPDGTTFAWTLEKAPDGMGVDPETGRVRWQPKEHQIGDHEVILRVSDLRGGSDVQTFTVTVRAVNQGPTITSDPVVEAFVDEKYVYAVKATDPEGDKVIFVVKATDPQRNTFNVPAFDPNNPDQMSVDSQGIIRWKPESGDLGDWTMDVVAKDELGVGTRQIYRLTVSDVPGEQDDPPVVTSTPVRFAAVNSIDDGITRPYVYTYRAKATDPDNEESGITYALTEKPTNMTIVASTGVISWEPTLADLNANEQPKSYYVTVEATSNGLKGSQRYRLDLRRDNHAPEIIPDWPTQIVAGLTFRQDVHVDEADNDPLQFTLNAGPTGLEMDRFGRVTWTTTTANITPAGEPGHRIEVTVTDTFGAIDNRAFFLKVVKDTSAPTVSLTLSPGNTIDKGKELTILVQAVDNVGVESITVDVIGSTFQERLSVNADGIAKFTPTNLEPFTVVATATDAAGNSGTKKETVFVTDPNDVDAPIVSISSPGDKAAITAPTNIVGTVKDPNNQLISWSLDYSALGEGNWKNITEQVYTPPNFLPNVGDPTPAVLGQFDTTMLRNGAYVLRLTAIDIGGNESIVERVVNVEGKLKLGNFTVSFEDITVPVAGIPITMVRTYDTLDANEQGEFGFGWSLTFKDTKVEVDQETLGGQGWGNYRAFETGTRVMVTLPDGTTEGHSFEPIPNDVLFGVIRSYKPWFRADEGNLSILEAPEVSIDNRQTGEWQAIMEEGLVTYNPADPAFGGVYQVTIYPERMKRTIDANTGELLEIEDRHKNVVKIKDTGVSSNRDRELKFERDWRGNITKVTDSRNNSLLYRYDTDGNLTAVYDRVAAAKKVAGIQDIPSVKYTYLGTNDEYAHYLDTIENPYGIKVVDNQYGSGGRLEKSLDAAGKEIAHTYNTSTLTEIVTDQNGKTSKSVFDTQGNVIRSENELGETVVRTYDPVSNAVLSERQIIGLDDSQSNETDDITTTNEVNRFGQPTLSTDSNGNVSATSYDSQGNPDTVTDEYGNKTRNYHNPSTGDLVSTTDPYGNQTAYQYDEHGDPNRIVRGGQGIPYGGGGYGGGGPGGSGGGGTSSGVTTDFVFSSVGDLKQLQTNGIKQTFDYDANGNQTTSTLAWVNPQDSTDTHSVVQTSVPDANDRDSQIVSSAGTSTTEYDLLGRPFRVTDELGKDTETVFDLRSLGIVTRSESTGEGGTTVWLVTSTVFDPTGRASYVTDPHPAGTPNSEITGIHTVFDDAGRVTTTERLKGFVIEVFDSTTGQTIPDPFNTTILTLSSRVAAAGTVTSSTNAQYSDGRVISTTDEYGRVAQTIYDDLGQTIETRVQSKTETGTDVWIVSRTIYDRYGRSDLATAPFILASTCALGACASPPVKATRAIYDDHGRLAKIQILKDVIVDMSAQTGLPVVTSAGSVVSTSETIYDDRGRVRRTIAHDGQITDSEYDSQGRQVATIVHPFPAAEVGLGAQYPGKFVRYRSELVFNQYGQVSREINNIIQVEDADGKVESKDLSKAQKTDYEYDQFGNQVRVTFGVGTAIESYVLARYDAVGRTTAEMQQTASSIDATWSETLKSFIVSGSSPVERIPTKLFEYDSQSRLSAVELSAVPDPDNGNQLTKPRYQYGYDALGSNTLIRDPLGHETRFTFDVQRHPLTRTLPLGFGADGKLGTGDDATLPEGNFKERFEYDNRGRQTLQVSIEGVVTKFVYDSYGRLSEQQFFVNEDAYINNPGSPSERSQHKYDAFGREIEVTQIDANGSRLTQAKYDSEGRITQLTTPEGIIGTTYDGLGRKTATKVYPVTANPAVDTPERITTYAYDVASRLKTVVEDLDPSSTLDTPLTTTHAYDLIGNLDRIDLPNGVITDYVFDSLNRLDKMTDFGPDPSPNDLSNNPKLTEFDYSVRADGKRIAATETFWLDSNGDTITEPHVNQLSWTYDNAGRMTDEVINHFDNALDQTEHFVYDLVGNRRTLTKDLVNNGTTDEAITYLYDSNDRLNTESLDKDVSLANGVDQTTSYGYTRTQQSSKSVVDDTTSQAVSNMTMTYDLQGLLSRVVMETLSGGSVTNRKLITYDYDSTGIRISSEQFDDANLNGTFSASEKTGRIEYLVDHLNFTGHQQVVKETTYNGLGIRVKTIEYSIVHDEVVQTVTLYDGSGNVTSEQIQVFGHDGHGSVRVLFDLAATILQAFTFDAYGQLVAIHNGAAQFVSNDAANALTSLLYSGEQFDARINQQYLRARFYDPATGRFNRLDPFSGDLESPQSLHKYSYTSGDPIQFGDPTGMFEGLIGMMLSMAIGQHSRAKDAGASLSVLNVLHKAVKLWEFISWAQTFVLAGAKLAQGDVAGAVTALIGVNPAELKDIFKELKNAGLTKLTGSAISALPPVNIAFDMPGGKKANGKPKGKIGKALMFIFRFVERSSTAQEIIGELGTFLMAKLMTFDYAKGLERAHGRHGPDFILRNKKNTDVWAIMEAKGGSSTLGTSGLVRPPRPPGFFIPPTVPRPYPQMGKYWIEYWLRHTYIKNSTNAAGIDLRTDFLAGKPMLAMVVSLNLQRPNNGKDVKIAAQGFIPPSGGLGYNAWPAGF